MTDVLRQEIEKLGGNEDDYVMLKDLNEDVDKPHDKEDDFDFSEFQKFHKGLNFGDVKHFNTVKDDSKPEPEEVKVEPVEEPVAVVKEIKVDTVTYVSDVIIKQLTGKILQQPKVRKSRLLPIGEDAEPWHQTLDKLYLSAAISEDFIPIKKDSEFIKLMKTKAGGLVLKEASFTTKAMREFVKTAGDAGTAKDKAAALTLKVASGAVANFGALDKLLNLTKKKSRRNFILCAALLRDILISDLLPLTRPLHEFHERSKFLIWSAKNQTHPMSDKGLMLCWYEDRLKTRVAEFVNLLQSVMNDPIERTTELSLEITAALLEQQPECEFELVSILVNKLGDPKSKVTKKCTFLLLKLLRKHPNMQPQIAAEVEGLLFRTNQSTESIYSAISFLNQLVFSTDRLEVPTRLLNLYFQLFTSEVLKKRQNVSQKILLGLLTGVNRAFPYVNSEHNETIMKHVDDLYKLVHNGTFIAGLQALMLLHQAFISKMELTDRYYNALYRLLLRPELAVESKRHPLLLNLVYRTITEDNNTARQKSFIKRLLMIAMTSKTSYQAAVLVLLGEVFKNNKLLKNVVRSNKSANISLVGGKTFNEAAAKNETFDSDDEDEHFRDADKKDEDVEQKKAVGWEHRKECNREKYDPWARNPTYSGADGSVSWEITSLANHFHPSVRMFAKDILNDTWKGYPGDPLLDFTIIRFLDRFVYKNPRKIEEHPQNVNINKRRRNNYLDTTQLPITSLEFLERKIEDLPPQDKFLHKYFTLRSSHGNNKVSDNDADEIVEDLSDTEFEEILNTKEKGWENRMKDLEYKLATPKERKRMKKNSVLVEPVDDFEELNDDEPDMGSLYSDEEVEEDYDDFSDEFDIEDVLDDEIEIASKKVKQPTKKRQKITAEVEDDSDLLGEMLEQQPASKQAVWETARMQQNGLKKRKMARKPPSNKRNKFKKKS